MNPISFKRIISLDIETTGLEVGKHVPISIGAVKTGIGGDSINSENSFYVQLEWDSLVVDPKAMQINKLDIVDPPRRDGVFNDKKFLLEGSMPADQGIHAFAEWLGGPEDDFPMFAMGKNVGPFDLLMLRSVWNLGINREWPFHYRSIDLNSLFFALSEINNYTFDSIKERINNTAWCDVHRLFERSSMGEGCPHHALSDAWWNVYAWEECLELLRI